MIPYPYAVDGPPELIERMRAIAQGITLGTSSSPHNSS
jgi:hypothetical protein